MRATAILALGALLWAPCPSNAQQIVDHELFLKSAEATRQALEQYGLYDNPAELRRVNDIGYRVAEESGFRDFPFTFHLIDMPEPNAFALPGGQIFVTRGMLDLDLDDDMLAGLMGHEIAHVVMRHGIRMQKRAALLNALSQAALVGVMIAASNDSQSRSSYLDPRDPRYHDSGSGDMVQGTYAAGIVVTELLLRSYSREFEDESDEEGQRWAAGAGFDPVGTQNLMTRMASRIPQSHDYGYWRTHPFNDQRMRAAEVRKQLLTVQEAEPVDDYRRTTQALLLGLAEDPKVEPGLSELFTHEALHAWPRGPDADRIRMADLHAARQRLEERPRLSRDYAALIARYEGQMEQVRSLTPESDFLQAAGQEIGEFRQAQRDAYPAFVDTWSSGVFETEFLETFLSNYPDSEHAGEAALELATAYSRSRRQTDAVDYFLRAWESAPDSEAGQRARSGLRNLVGFLERLAALQQLAEQRDDLELQRLARERLAKLAPTYKTLDNGAEYLNRFPSGDYVDEVNARLESLAENLHGEILLYQTVGDTVNALERIQQILKYAPLSPAAERLRQQAVLEG
jgi:predicted Zn-dependent protease